MPPAEPARVDEYRGLDDVDEFIRLRQRDTATRARREASLAKGAGPAHGGRTDRRAERSEERARARELLGADFFWSDLKRTSRRAAAPAPESLTRAWDDAIEIDTASAVRPQGVSAVDEGHDAVDERHDALDKRHDALDKRYGSLDEHHGARARGPVRELGPAQELLGERNEPGTGARGTAVLERPGRSAGADVWAADGEAPVRRTVVITGRGAERYVAPRRSHDASMRRHERDGFRPDRVAMWAVLLGLVLLLAAATSSHAAVLHAALHHGI
jgi:hypothetical protein